MTSEAATLLSVWQKKKSLGDTFPVEASCPDPDVRPNRYGPPDSSSRGRRRDLRSHPFDESDQRLIPNFDLEGVAAVHG